MKIWTYFLATVLCVIVGQNLNANDDREGNQRADELAKQGAALYRVPQSLRECVHTAAKAADYVARHIIV